MDDVQSSKTTPGKLAGLDISSVIERYISGIPIPSIAKELGVHKSSLSRAIRSAIPEQEWEQIKEEHYETCLDEGLQAIKDAENDCNLARAREAYLRRVEWRAATEHKRWQPQTKVVHDIGPDLGDVLRQAHKRVAQARHVAVLTPPEVVDVQVVPAQVTDSSALVQSSDD